MIPDIADHLRNLRAKRNQTPRVGSFDLRSLPVPFTPPQAVVEKASPFVAVVYSLAAIYYTLCLGIGSQPADYETVHIVNFAHITIPVLAVGIAVLPIRVVWLAYAVFALCFVMLELMMLGQESVTGWSAIGMIKALIVAATIGTVGGSSVRILMQESRSGGFTVVPEQIFLAGGLVIIVVGGIITALALWIELQHLTTPERVWEMIGIALQRIFRLGALTAAATLIFLVKPGRQYFPEILLQLSIFAVLGALATHGYFLNQKLDPVLLTMVFLFLRPVNVSIAGCLAGISLYVMMTGVYVDLPVNMTADEIRVEIQANLLFAILLVVAMARVASIRVQKVQGQTLGRMSRAQELSRFGYFVYNLDTQVASFDPLTQRILNVGATLPADGFVQRVHPEDRDAVVTGATRTEGGGTSFTFRFAMDGLWSETCEERIFRGFALFEETEDRQMLTYGIVVDFTQEYQQEAQLRKVLVELSERQGQQTQLFSIISHELRTPASILSMLADELDEGRKWQDVGPKMRGVLEQLLSILSDMRQTVRPEQNLPIRLESFVPADVVTAVADGFRGMANSRGISLRLTFGDGAQTPCTSDRVRLNQVLSNLLKNAILHSQATEIRLSFERDDKGFGIWTVADNGRNIPQEQRENLFRPFARGKTSGMRVDGSGLGLYVAKSAMELLGGSLEYVDHAISGAEFRISLPLDPVSGPEPATALPVQEDMGDLATLRVLIVEDSDTMGEILLARLKPIFGQVEWRRDGGSGLDYALNEKPDVVMTDLFMPVMTGNEVARKLRSEGYRGRIIGMTAAEMGEDVEMFRESGVDVILTKPVRIADLERALGKTV